jgi:hypothetical protein
MFFISTPGEADHSASGGRPLDHAAACCGTRPVAPTIGPQATAQRRDRPVPPWEILLRDDRVKGFAVGIGVAVLVPLAVIALAPVIKPAARSAAKAGLRAYEQLRQTVEDAGEIVEDLVAETQAELRARRVDDAVQETVDEQEPPPAEDAVRH